MIFNFCFIFTINNLVFQSAFELLAQQSEYSAHIIYSAWWNVDAKTLVTEFMNNFGIREIVLTKLFMTRQTIVSSVTIQIIIISLTSVNSVYFTESWKRISRKILWQNFLAITRWSFQFIWLPHCIKYFWQHSDVDK